MRFATLDQWLEWMEQCHPQEIELGLERISAVAEQLGLLGDRSFQVVTVAGTNGKGSTVALLVALLRAQGLSVGCYTSPHFLHYNERVQLNGESVSDQQLVEAFARVDEARGDTQLTYFEYGTLAALEIFQRNAPDVVVLEVGLGGRLDAVNIIDPDLAIVTNVALDHEDWLGSDREQIGFEKAGIYRANGLALCGESTPPQSVVARATELGCEWLCREQHFSAQRFDEDWSWQGVDPQGGRIELTHLALPKLGIDAAATALQTVAKLGYLPSDAALNSVLSQTGLMGRFQRFDLDGVEVILDVAHNPAAAHRLAERLGDAPINGRTAAIMAVMADKQVDEVLKAMTPVVQGWFVGDLKDNPRALPAKDLADQLYTHGHQLVSVSKNLRQAYARARSLLRSGDRLIVFGSFFTVAALLPVLQRDGAREMIE